jgi:diketogulonate reductase-like aldo/keto reductase
MTVALEPGGAIPLLGFGTWQLAGDDAYNGVRAALEVGYRHVDTATGYANEDRVGAALGDCGLDRSEVFVTTKCPPERVGHELETLEESLAALRVDFVDLWLVHWPPNGEARPDTWAAFVAAAEQEKARAIGVSNYSLAQIDELVAATGVSPAVNQIPWSPFAFDEQLARSHEERHVVLEGYSPLKRSRLDDPVLVEIARVHGKTPAQVVLRWHLEHGVVVIPRSARRERIAENFDLFDFALSPAEVGRIDALAS